jgi:hypothetical protein
VKRPIEGALEVALPTRCRRLKIALMDEGGPVVHPATQIIDAFRMLLRRPFAEVLLLTLLIAAASAIVGTLLDSRGRSEYGYLVTISSIFFVAVSTYLQIAVVLAAAGEGTTSHADAWIRVAFKRRCFWRYLGVTLLSSLLILVGALALLIGAIVVGAILFVSQPAVVLERTGPGDALSRSAELTRPVRREAAIIFAALSLPAYAGYLLVPLFHLDLGIMAAIGLTWASNIFSLASTFAATRVFVRLGGTPTPPLDTLLYKAKVVPGS